MNSCVSLILTRILHACARTACAGLLSGIHSLCMGNHTICMLVYSICSYGDFRKVVLLTGPFGAVDKNWRVTTAPRATTTITSTAATYDHCYPLCWSRQQHLTGAWRRSPVSGGGGGCVEFAKQSRGKEKAGRRRDMGVGTFFAVVLSAI